MKPSASSAPQVPDPGLSRTQTLGAFAECPKYTAVKAKVFFPRQDRPPELDLGCICPHFLVLVDLLLPSTGSFLGGGGFTWIMIVVKSGLMWAAICRLPRGNLVAVLILKKR